MHHSMEFAAKMASAYSATCKPLCQELKLPQTAFDILLFLANNPDYKTASDIVEIRKIKANLVSVNVEKLVKEGYLKRQAAEGDRRKVLLLCTDKAMPVIRRGRALLWNLMKMEKRFRLRKNRNVRNRIMRCRDFISMIMT